MKLEIFTIVLDGMPWITQHIAAFNRLRCPWRWTIAHGVSANIGDTRWIKAQLPRLSQDGTTEYLDDLAATHPNVRVLNRKIWQGKTVQCNACLEGATAPSVILQVDADEIRTTEQIEQIMAVFERWPDIMRMQFFCNYFLGPNIVAVGDESYGNWKGEWLRAWRMTDAAQRFQSHEPPVFAGNAGEMMGRRQTRELGLVFDHHAYATKKQLEYKQEVYRYPGAVASWQKLQRNTIWPTALKVYMPWVNAEARADLFQRP